MRRRISAASVARLFAVGGFGLVVLALPGWQIPGLQAQAQAPAQGAQGRGAAGRGRGEAPTQVQSKLMGVAIPDLSEIGRASCRERV